MAKLQSFTVLIPLILLLSQLDLRFARANRLISITNQSTNPNSNQTSFSFSTELIHRFSLKSPFYRRNQTFMERVREYIEISEHRALTYMRSFTGPNWKSTLKYSFMRPYIIPNKALYLLRLQVGTPSQIRLLTFDTGGGQTWIKCWPCHSCFYSKTAAFDPGRSSSYSKLPCDNPVCQLFYKCEDLECRYALQYGDGSTVRGTASLETFTFTTPHKPNTVVSNVLFGCTHEARGTFDSDSDGIVGMNSDPISLVSQLDTFVLYRFSHCFPKENPDGTQPNTFLKFGTDPGFIGPGVVKMRVVKHPNTYGYGLDVVDISVGDTRLNFPAGTFDVRPDGTGGMIIDSAAALSYLEKDIYRKVHDAMVSYFSDKGVDQRLGCSGSIQLCYNMPSSEYSEFPTVTFHMKGGDLRIEPENVFMISKEEKIFMLAMAPTEGKSFLGAMQQRNTRFIYDLSDNSLAFVPEDCSQDEG